MTAPYSPSLTLNPALFTASQPSPRLRRENRIQTIQASLAIEAEQPQHRADHRVVRRPAGARSGPRHPGDAQCHRRLRGPVALESNRSRPSSGSPRAVDGWLDRQLSQRAVEKHLAALQRAGRLLRHGSPRAGYWQVL